MADNSNITPVAALKADIPHYPTPLASAFAALLPALDSHIEAERDIEDVDIWNPAFRAWLTDAEVAFEAVTTNLFTVLATDVIAEDDKPLKRMAMLIEAMIGSEEPEMYMHLYGLLPRFEHLFHCNGSGPAAQERTLMLTQARSQIDTMATLLTYDGEVAIEQTVEVMTLG
ncbi:hypothetical protein ACG74X_19410 [Marivita sp. S0852]|uniref:hypothetical protein n=1 Tax=Marivita sp. S0852 TaxID=3373893 RepID=UPI00398242E0